MHSCAVPFHPTQATCSISEARLIYELLSLCGASDEKGSLPLFPHFNTIKADSTRKNYILQALFEATDLSLSTYWTHVGTPNSAQQVCHAQGTLLKFCLLRQAGGFFSDSKRLTTRH
ncbi:hypothetical protein Pelo_10491 [Pelomyxa schiedti]|nr:hypothetical protein Pelo_10491 [Pelomyxa schiedti]